MTIGTDLAIEAGEINKDAFKNADISTHDEGGVHITQMTIDENASACTGMTAGLYITCEMKPLTKPIFDEDEAITAVGSVLGKLLPQDGCVVVAGLGNPDATPDALGPSACEHILATRHIVESGFKMGGLENLRSVCVLRPGVLGQTGIEVQEMLRAVSQAVGATCLIAVDALAARSVKRLGCTVQLSDAGLSPGSGIGNRRTALTADTLGIPVIAVGVPTMVNAAVLAHDLTGQKPNDAKNLIVTPKDIDTLILRSGKLLGMAINAALHPSLSPEEIAAIMV